MNPTYTLRKVWPEVYMELERIHRGRLEIEAPDESNPRRLLLLEGGWLRATDTLFGNWLEITPLALTQTGQLRPNRDHKFVRAGNAWQLIA